jgi:hypothetical protein
MTQMQRLLPSTEIGSMAALDQIAVLGRHRNQVAVVPA